MGCALVPVADGPEQPHPMASAEVLEDSPGFHVRGGGQKLLCGLAKRQNGAAPHRARLGASDASGFELGGLSVEEAAPAASPCVVALSARQNDVLVASAAVHVGR